MSVDLQSSGPLVAVETDDERGNGDIWVYDGRTGAGARITRNADDEVLPLLSPDGSRILFSSTRSGSGDLYTRSSRGGDEEQLYYASPQRKWPFSWTADGRVGLRVLRDGHPRITVYSKDAGGEIEVDQPTIGNNACPVFSPDGNWLAFCSDETGRWEVYVQRATGPM